MASNNHLPVTSFRRSSRLKRKQLNHLEGNEESDKIERASSQEDSGKPAERIGSAMLILQSQPTTEEWDGIVAATKNGIALTGTVAERPAGPVIGLVDIGSCDDAYFFRMSLPGVSRSAGDFSCEIEKNGRVLVQGVTVTGQKKVCRQSHIFEMQTQHLCPPGDFSISFQLPGPVDHREFTATLGSDGIFEGIILRRDQEDNNKVQVGEAQSTPV